MIILIFATFASAASPSKLGTYIFHHIYMCALDRGFLNKYDTYILCSILNTLHVSSIRISTPILYLTHRPLDGQGPVQIFLIMINIVNLTRTPPPIVAAVPPLPPAPLYSQDTSPKHSIICLRRTIPSNHGSNTSIPKLLS